jgi:hypothetical protein
MKSIIRHFVLIGISVSFCGCMNMQKHEEKVLETEYNPVRNIQYELIQRMELSVVYGDKDHPFIVGGTEKILVVERGEDIRKIFAAIKKIPDGSVILPGCGFLVRVDLIDHHDLIVATVDVLWDACSIIILDSKGVYFSGRSKELPLLCFDLLKREKRSYLEEVLQGKRPTPPNSSLRERFPFDSLETKDLTRKEEDIGALIPERESKVK